MLMYSKKVFALTGIMSYVIPEVPRSLATQMKREKLLAQEAKYEKGMKIREDEEDLFSVLRDAGYGNSRAGASRSTWARRLSKLSDGLDAHVQVSTPIGRDNLNQQPQQQTDSPTKTDDKSVVWEVT